MNTSLNLLLKRNDEKFWSSSNCDSYGLSFNIIMNTRSSGKTTTCLLNALNRFIKYGEQFVLLRRYKNEHSKSPTLLNKLCEGIKSRGDGLGGGVWYTKDVNNKAVNVGFYCPLSVYQMYKSANEFDNVTTIIFDEFTLERKSLVRYLPNEVNAFLEMINTITRDRKNYRVFLLGNFVDNVNPYFEYFNVPRFEHMYVNRDQELYIEKNLVKDAIIERKRETPLAKLTAGTLYDDYNTGESSLSKVKIKIGTKKNTDKLITRFVYGNYTLNIYSRNLITFYIESKNKIINDNYTIDFGSTNFINYTNFRMFKRTYVGKILIDCYYNRECEFDSEESFTLFSEIMDYM